VAVFNRRNAAVGWLALFVGKRVLRRKAKQAVPALDPESRRPNKSAVALLAASVVGVATFWRRRSENEETEPES
jgi:MYXO-CTERM domain-containing protein